LFELQTAICHSWAGSCLPFEQDKDFRFTRKFYDLSVEELKQTLKKHGAILIRSNEPLWRNVFPKFTRGPRKGMSNFKKEPEIYEDRMYRVEFEQDDVVAREGEIEERRDGTFTVKVVESA